MSDHTSIEWTDATWNPIQGANGHRWYCERISPGCDHCYAANMNYRFTGHTYPAVGDGLTPAPIRWDAHIAAQPASWRRPRRVFVCSMTDLFGEWVPDEFIQRAWETMAACPRHQFQVLTKRPQRLAAWWRERWAPWCEQTGRPEWAVLPNVWLGATVEHERFAWRARTLTTVPAVVHFLSTEPLLGPLPSLDLADIEWVIAGGESGPHHRPLDLDWVRDLRDRCQAAGTAFFFKQVGGRTPKAGGRLLDGRTWDEHPTPSRHPGAGTLASGTHESATVRG
jgi:protein gp37